MGFGPKASVFAAREGQVSSALPQGRATPKLLGEGERELSLPFPIPAEFGSKVGKELRFESLGSNVGNHFRGTQLSEI